MVVKKKYKALGKGLDALISQEDVYTQGSSSINEIAIDRIFANPEQPRREMDPDALQELAESISQIGIIQPITLRLMDDGSYQIIAGERRWRASKIAGLTTIPAYVRTASDENIMQMALVENIQREDLNAIEIALGYNKLMEQLDLTQEQVAEKVGKKRTTVANYLRLLKLPADVQLALRNKKIDQGHARALLGLQSPSMQLRLFKEIQKNNYSVRKVEGMVQALNNGESVPDAKRHSPEKLPGEYIALRDNLASFLHTKVQMNLSSDGKGRISFSFNSHEELEKLVKMFDKMKG